MSQVFSNNAESSLSASITAAATSVTLLDGTSFSAPTGGDYALATIEEGSSVEIVKITARTGNTLTVVRAQEGTTAAAFSNVAVISERLTAGSLGLFEQNLATGTDALSLGVSTTASAIEAVAIGAYASATANYTTAIQGGTASAADSVAISYGSAKETGGIAIGSGAAAGQNAGAGAEPYAVAIGNSAKAYEDRSIAIGQSATAGVNAATADPYSIAIGASSDATGANSVAFGYLAQATADNAVALGPNVANAVADTARFGTSNTNTVDLDASGNVTIPGNYVVDVSGKAFQYATGAGGAVTQITSRTTGVTLNTACGQITLVSAAGSASWQTFTVTNSVVAATDTIIVNQASGTDLNMIHVTGVGAGTFNISFATTGGTTTEQPVFNFAVIKAVAA